jgi:hypothetical protein
MMLEPVTMLPLRGAGGISHTPSASRTTSSHRESWQRALEGKQKNENFLLLSGSEPDDPATWGRPFDDARGAETDMGSPDPKSPGAVSGILIG